MNRIPCRLVLTQLGFVFLACLHLYQLAGFPGLHYDEAWAMNHAWRLASEKGFWALSAMSPYTAPWAHYWAALWLKLLGPSLLAFRASQVFLSLAGLLALHFSLPRASRFLFPWAVALLPGLLLNHRFAVELTGLHVLCFGALCLGISRRWWTLAFIAAVVGSTAHVLFYGVPLALLAALTLSHTHIEKKARTFFAAYFAMMLLFFLRVALGVPEKGKAAALLATALVGFAFLALDSDRLPIWRSPWWGRLVALASVPFLANAIFFGQGYWTASVYTGLNVWGLYPSFAPPNFLLTLLAVLLAAVGALLYAPAFVRYWLAAGSVALGAMMLKPAPRYYELVMLGLSCLLVIGAAPFEKLWNPPWSGKLRQPRVLAGLGVLLTLGLAGYTNMEMAEGLVEVSELVGGPREASLGFLTFRDSSRDFLDKQELVRFLGGSGCAPGDIESHDPRLVEELKALSLGDWFRHERLDGGGCPYDYVASRLEPGAIGQPHGAFLLREKKK